MMKLQEDAAAIVLKDPDVESVASFIGSDGTNSTTNSGRLTINLKNRDQRQADASTIIARLEPKLRELDGISVYLQSVQDLQIDSRVSRTQFQFTLEDADPAELAEWAPKVAEEMKKLPQLDDVASDQETAGLQMSLTIDRDTASRLGISPQLIDDTIYDAFGQRQISIIFTQLNLYRVILEVKPEFQQNPQALDKIYLSVNGSQVPLSSFVHMAPTLTPLAIDHQGQFPSVTLSFNTKAGISLGEAVDAINEMNDRMGLPPGVHGTFQGTAQAFKESLASEPILLLAALITVYIVLGVLYESYIHPITILSTAPVVPASAPSLALMVCHMEVRRPSPSSASSCSSGS